MLPVPVLPQVSAVYKTGIFKASSGDDVVRLVGNEQDVVENDGQNLAVAVRWAERDSPGPGSKGGTGGNRGDGNALTAELVEPGRVVADVYGGAAVNVEGFQTRPSTAPTLRW